MGLRSAMGGLVWLGLDEKTIAELLRILSVPDWESQAFHNARLAPWPEDSREVCPT
jgi:hypothetical protein